MAQLLLTTVSSVGGAIGKAGIGAAIARTVAGTAAAYAAGIAERLIFGPRKRKVTGPRLESLQIQASTEGAPILRVYGRARVAGEIIWAANFKETVAETTENAGKGGRLGTKTTTTDYLYSLSFAVGLCEGEIDRIARVWADGKPFDLSPHNVRVHKGSEDQLPDAAIEALEGESEAPAFRGLAYIVFEDLPLAEFGNRIPQLSFEIEKSLRQEDEDALENAVNAVTMIPGSGEFAFGATKVFRETGEGATVSENVHNNDGVTDFVSSLDALEAALPNVASVSLVVSWFGTDLRAGHCELKPGVEAAAKTTTPYEWRAGGAQRGDAHVVSLHEGAPAYGGTPSDRSVVEAIAALKARGLSVMFHPFILMDIPHGNELPFAGGAGAQPAYPWRGRISVGANDKTAAAASDIAAFFGTAAPSDFAIAGGEVIYSGPAEWSFRRMILHAAKLCALAGGVDRFLIGSELKGVTTARSDASTFPAVAALQALAADVAAILPEAEISYGADWSEYSGHQPADGAGDVFFHLDPLWSDPNIAFVGIDNYAPLADWRDGFAHADALAGFKGSHDLEYLKANIEGGENYDWFYADEAARNAQTRTPISDGAYGEPWVYRTKDFRNWWSRAHYNRPGGVRAAAPTAWVPESKRIVFTEAGCAAVDKGANAPNLFFDPKSSESGAPPYSRGTRDDLAQRRAIEALVAYWRDPAHNPTSSLYGGAMLETAPYIYAWDARPFPFFPALGDIWGDAANWERGHWLNGRAGRAPLDLLVAALAREAGVEVDARGLKGDLAGYIVERPLSAREAIDPLADVFQFDMVETAAALRFQARNSEPALVIAAGDLAEREEGAVTVALAQREELPAAFRLGFLDEGADYAPAVVEERAPIATNVREAGAEIAAVMGEAEATARARAILADAHLMRETATFSLPPSMLGLEPGDVVALEEAGPARLWRVTEIVDGADRRVEAVRVAASVYDSPPGAFSFRPPQTGAVYAAPIWALMDLPLLGAEAAAGEFAVARFAAFADPWPGAVALYRDSADAPVLTAIATQRAVMGKLAASLPPAGAGRWDARTIRVRLAYGAFVSRSEEEVLTGANLLAVETAAGWEVLQFEGALLDEDGVWTLSRLLRAQAGTEDQAALGAAEGARAVLITQSLAEARYPLSLRGTEIAFEAGPARELAGGETFTARHVTLAARALLPLAPVHLRAVAEAGGLRLSWIRRTRLGGDSWEGEVPLAETYERYRVEVYDGETLLRSADVSAPDYLYTEEAIIADFGGSGIAGAAAPRFTVAQLSDLAGAGIRAERGLSA